MKPTDVVFDVFAGVGPFAVPACKHQATVFANDLNPHSYQALVKNIPLNKCKGQIKCFNLDGREFIQTCVKEQFTKLYALTDIGSGEMFEGTARRNISNVYVIMNLPAKATTFLDAFAGILGDLDTFSDVPLPRVYCYCFTDFQEAVNTWQGDITMEIKQRVIHTVGCGLCVDNIDVRFVRNVSPQKDMMCVSFIITKDILLGKATLEETSDINLQSCQGRQILATVALYSNLISYLSWQQLCLKTKTC